MKKYIFFSLITTILLLTACKNKNLKENLKTTTNTQNYPNSILSLSPSFTEILYAINAQDQISAVSEYCDYPEQAKTKPVVGGFDGKTLSIEKILSFKPDLVCITDGMHNFLIEPLTQYNIPYYMSSADSIQKIKQDIIELGKLTGHIEKANSVVSNMTSTIDSAKRTRPDKITIYYEIWNNPYISAGYESFINDVISSAGGENLFADIKEAYPIVSEETIIARNPDLILIPQSSGLTVDSIKNRPGWQSICAVKQDNIHIIDDNLYSRPGPRITLCIQELAKLIDYTRM